MFDVAVIGGSVAGLSGALQLARSRRSVIVFDDETPRNAMSHEMHGYLGFDGQDPAALLSRGREEVRGYGARILNDRIVTAEGQENDFTLTTDGGDTFRARRLLVATGVRDELPNISGLAERWGKDVLHCPYCHGYEVRDQRILVLAGSPATTHRAMLMRQLSERVDILAEQGQRDLLDTDLLNAAGVGIVDGTATEVRIDNDKIVGLELADGRVLAADVILVSSVQEPRAEPFAAIGLFPERMPNGDGYYLATAQGGTTRVPGVWAAGNISDPGVQALPAAAAGSIAGAMINADLIITDNDPLPSA